MNVHGPQFSPLQLEIFELPPFQPSKDAAFFADQDLSFHNFLNKGDETSKPPSIASSSTDSVDSSAEGMSEENSETRTVSGIFADNNINDKYAIEECLNEGSFGVVFGVVDCETGSQYAVKRFEWAEMGDLEQEIRLLQIMQHPNVIGMHEVIHTPNWAYIVLERGCMDLWQYKHFNRLDECALCQVTLGLLNALSYIHSQNICHLDIKPFNILVMKDVPVEQLRQDHIKLCDFGLSAVGDYSSNGGRSRGYFAPEMAVSGTTFDGKKADMWSFACTLLELADEMPFGWKKAYELCTVRPATFRRRIEWLVKLFKIRHHFDKTNLIIDLICSCLVMEPLCRKSASDCLEHEWFQEDPDGDDHMSWLTDQFVTVWD